VNAPTGSVLTFGINDFGNGYAVNDTLTINSGDGTAEITVTEVGNGGVNSADVVYGGYYYYNYYFVEIDGGAGGDNATGYIYTDGYGAIQYLWISYPGSGYTEGTYDILGGGGYGATVYVYPNTSFIAGDITNAGDGYHVASSISTTTTSGSGSGLKVNVLTINETAGEKASIAIGKYSGTGGYSNSIAIGRGVINSATRQASIGNGLIIEGIYASDTKSSALLSTSKVKIAKLNISNLPTSSAGLSAGDIWNDSGTLKVV
jgi:hypothetical protein